MYLNSPIVFFPLTFLNVAMPQVSKVLLNTEIKSILLMPKSNGQLFNI
jgi:hypothetical protein